MPFLIAIDHYWGLIFKTFTKNGLVQFTQQRRKQILNFLGSEQLIRKFQLNSQANIFMDHILMFNV
jgi:hypothetical protein